MRTHKPVIDPYYYEKQIVIDLTGRPSLDPLALKLKKKWDINHPSKLCRLYKYKEEETKEETKVETKVETKEDLFPDNKRRLRIYIVAHGHRGSSNIGDEECEQVAYHLASVLSAMPEYRADINLVVCQAATGAVNIPALSSDSTAARLHRLMYEKTGRRDLDVIARNTFVGHVSSWQGVALTFSASVPEDAAIGNKQIFVYREADRIMYATCFPQGSINRVEISKDCESFKDIKNMLDSCRQNPFNTIDAGDASAINFQALLKIVSHNRHIQKPPPTRKLTELKKHNAEQKLDEKMADVREYGNKQLMRRQLDSKILFTFNEHGQQVMINAYFARWRNQVLRIIKNNCHDEELESLGKYFSEKMSHSEMAEGLMKYIREISEDNVRRNKMSLFIEKIKLEYTELQSMRVNPNVIKSEMPVYMSIDQLMKHAEQYFNKREFKKFLNVIRAIKNTVDEYPEELSSIANYSAQLKTWLRSSEELLELPYKNKDDLLKRMERLLVLYLDSKDPEPDMELICEVTKKYMAEYISQDKFITVIDFVDLIIDKIKPEYSKEIFYSKIYQNFPRPGNLHDMEYLLKLHDSRNAKNQDTYKIILESGWKNISHNILLMTDTLLSSPPAIDNRALIKKYNEIMNECLMTKFFRKTISIEETNEILRDYIRQISNTGNPKGLLDAIGNIFIARNPHIKELFILEIMRQSFRSEINPEELKEENPDQADFSDFLVYLAEKTKIYDAIKLLKYIYTYKSQCNMTQELDKFIHNLLGFIQHRVQQSVDSGKIHQNKAIQQFLSLSKFDQIGSLNLDESDIEPVESKGDLFTPKIASPRTPKNFAEWVKDKHDRSHANSGHRSSL